MRCVTQRVPPVPSDAFATLPDVSTTSPDFPSRLREGMELEELTVAALHERCAGAFSVRTLIRWRQGHSAPGIEALPILARALDTSCDWLLGVSSPDQENA